MYIFLTINSKFEYAWNELGDLYQAPYYEAIKTFTLQENEIEYYLSTKALEIREAAYTVIDKIKQYL